LDESKYPDIKEAIQILKSWNRTADIHESGITLFGFVLKNVFERRHCSDDCFISGVTVDEAELVADLRSGCDTLKKYFGTVNVEWGKVMRNVRGNVNMPMRGFPDMLSPVYPKDRTNFDKYELTPDFGDTYTMFAEFDNTGNVKLKALQPAGNSLNPGSPHYNDQIALFSQLRMRELSLKKEDVMKMAESVYHPE
jgi:acyl-homoserine-lactone acylase